MTPEFHAKMVLWTHVEHCDDQIERLESGPYTSAAVVEREFWAHVREQLIEILTVRGMM